jgi:hypothetical protein
MPSLWQAASRARLVQRAARLTAETPPRWGRMTCPQMLAHVNDALRMATGELSAARRAGPLRYFPLKQLFAFWLPIPHGVPTSPELLARMDRAQFAAEASAFPGMLDRFAARSADAVMPEHPAFGFLGRSGWGLLAYRHVDHHLRQFGA